MTNTGHHPVTVLLADDDADDRDLVEAAMQEGCIPTDLKTVRDGEELMDYLLRRPPFDLASAPRPGLILLDLAMPRKDGRQALAEIKQHPDLRAIPVVVMTTSSDGEDVCGSYDLGASSYVTKPASFSGLVATMAALSHYWFEVVELPS